MVARAEGEAHYLDGRLPALDPPVEIVHEHPELRYGALGHDRVFYFLKLALVERHWRGERRPTGLNSVPCLIELLRDDEIVELYHEQRDGAQRVYRVCLFDNQVEPLDLEASDLFGHLFRKHFPRLLAVSHPA